jgi:hypothetical protein
MEEVSLAIPFIKYEDYLNVLRTSLPTVVTALVLLEGIFLVRG